MANLKQNIAARVAAQAEAAAAAAKEAELAAVVEKDIVSTIPDVAANKVRIVRNDVCPGINGGALLQEAVRINGHLTTIAAETPEELAAIKERMSRGIIGDGKLHYECFINGQKCDCVGATPELLNEDIHQAELFAAAHKAHMWQDVSVATECVSTAGLEGHDYSDHTKLEQVTFNGYTFIINYSNNVVLDADALEEIADLSDITSSLSKEDTRRILLMKAQAVIQERLLAAAEAEEDEDEEEYWDDDEEEDEEDWDE